jgi:hypothetical protein
MTYHIVTGCTHAYIHTLAPATVLTSGDFEIGDNLGYRPNNIYIYLYPYKKNT